MVTEDYVSFEIAKLLKEKGFDSDECIAIYDLGDNNAFIRDSGIFENGPEDYLEFQWGEEWKRFGYYLAPTLQMAMKWLREVHKLSVRPRYDEVEDEKEHLYYVWFFDILSMNPYKTLVEPVQGYSTYEEACEAAIKYCLTNLI